MQRDSLLYERLTISANKEKILELSEKGHYLKNNIKKTVKILSNKLLRNNKWQN